MGSFEKRPASGADRLAGDGLSQRVLLVEDYEANVVAVSLLLKHMGYVCDIARTGVQALDKIQTNDYCAVLMDVEMPGLSGLEVTSRVRELEREEGRVPAYIIGVTANGTAGDKRHCLESGMDAYLAKPFKHEELSERLQAAATRMA